VKRHRPDGVPTTARVSSGNLPARTDLSISNRRIDDSDKPSS
jgi:hypothetical protein